MFVGEGSVYVCLGVGGGEANGDLQKKKLGEKGVYY